MNDDFLSQEEIDALLRAAGEDEDTGRNEADDGQQRAAAPDAVVEE